MAVVRTDDGTHRRREPGRRHLDKGQKIAMAVELEPYFAKKAKKRQGARNDLEENVPPSSNSGGKSRSKPKARDQAARACRRVRQAGVAGDCDT